jgi:hypothetical protein
MFRNWFNDVENKSSNSLGVCAIVWAIWNCRNDLTFNKKNSLFTSYPYGYSLDLILVLPFARGATDAYVYWMQPTGDRRSGYLQP